jgi:cell wall-associated NlpC family hydrolase
MRKVIGTLATSVLLISGAPAAAATGELRTQESTPIAASDVEPVVANLDEIRLRAEIYVQASHAGEPDPFYGSAGYYRLCARLAARINGYPHSGYWTAIGQWRSYVELGIAHPGDTDPPPGALLFWETPGGGAGHVAVYLGDGLVVSNDVYDEVPGNGGVYYAPIDEFSDGRWNLPYLGWAPPAYE